MAYGDQGDARDARLNHPTGVAVGALGNVYIADRDNHRIRRVAPDGIITTIAGTGAPGNTGDNGPATLARMNGPSSVSLDAAGDLYIADTGNHRVREFAPGGIMLPVASTVSPVDAVADAAGTRAHNGFIKRWLPVWWCRFWADCNRRPGLRWIAMETCTTPMRPRGACGSARLRGPLRKWARDNGSTRADSRSRKQATSWWPIPGRAAYFAWTLQAPLRRSRSTARWELRGTLPWDPAEGCTSPIRTAIACGC
jgi:hypothetical protein